MMEPFPEGIESEEMQGWQANVMHVVEVPCPGVVEEEVVVASSSPVVVEGLAVGLAALDTAAVRRTLRLEATAARLMHSIIKETATPSYISSSMPSGIGSRFICLITYGQQKGKQRYPLSIDAEWYSIVAQE
ncbi:unnamed protein product [Cuscuta campestris]|uniref:Uncharacterized protein n=1 Tax=Cuscuta campestris TaxID=132261 RepID=A0A484L9P5_9ASTE|nr:unnamed protein product [Cuscuta campestris]